MEDYPSQGSQCFSHFRSHLPSDKWLQRLGEVGALYSLGIVSETGISRRRGLFQTGLSIANVINSRRGCLHCSSTLPDCVFMNTCVVDGPPTPWLEEGVKCCQNRFLMQIARAAAKSKDRGSYVQHRGSHNQSSYSFGQEGTRL